MPDYNVTSPDGKSYRVTAPEGATQDEIIARAQAHHEQSSQGNIVPEAVLQHYRNGMSEADRRQLESDVKQGLIQLPQGAQLGTTAPEPSMMSKVAQGAIAVPEAIGTTGLNVITGVVGDIAGKTAAITKSILDGSFGSTNTQDIANEQEYAANIASKFHVPAITDTGKQYQSAIESGMQQLAPIAPFTHELGLIGQGASNTMAALPKVSQYVQAVKNPTAMATDEALSAPKPAVQAPMAQEATMAAPEAAAIQETAPTIPQAEKGYQYKAPAIEELHPDVVAQLKQNKPDITPEEASRHIEAATLPVPMNMSEGQGLLDPVKISNEMNMRGVKEDYARLFNEQNYKLKQNIDVVKEQSAPDVSHLDIVDAGQHLLDATKSVVETDKRSVDADYQALRDANAGKFPVDGKAFAQNALKIIDSEDKLSFLKNRAPEIAGKLEEYASGKKEMNHNLFELLKSELAAESRKFDRAGDGTAGHIINVVRGELESLPLSEDLAAAAKPLADKARANSRSVFEKIKSDPAYRAAYDDDVKRGESSPLADNFINKYVIKAPRANLEQLVNKLSNDKEAKQTIAASVIDHLKSSGGIDSRTGSGNLRQSGYNKALTNLSPKIDLLVDKPTADLLHQIGNVARYTQFQPHGSFVSTSGTAPAMLAAAATTAEHTANIAAKGIPVGTAVRKAAEYFGAKKASEKALTPLGKGSVEKISESSMKTKTAKEKLHDVVDNISKDEKINNKLEEKKKNPKAYKIWLKSISENEKTKAIIKAVKKAESLTEKEQLILLATQQNKGESK